MTYQVTKKILDVEQYDKDWMPENLIDAIGWLQQKLSEVPIDMRSQATIEIRSEVNYDESVATIEITGRRDETDEERTEREARQFHAEQTRRLFQQAQERATYDALKRKYG